MAALFEFEVTITSQEMIKPSSPTPRNHRTLEFGLLDQLAPPVHMPLVYFYKSNTIKNLNLSTLIKKSLSNALVDFYPFAGRVATASIDCNDEGVEYYEAKVSASLVDFMRKSNPDDLSKLLPFAPLARDKDTIVTGVQMNNFSCGGRAIGVCIAHKLVDAITYAAFMNSWAIHAREGNTVTPPNFLASSIYPRRDLDGYNSENMISKENIVTKRLIFDKETLESLEKLIVIEGTLQSKEFSKAEIVSAFLWKRFVEIAKAKPNPPKVYLASHTINTRTKLALPATERNTYGNMLCFSVAAYPMLAQGEVRFPEMVSKLSEAAKQIDDKFIEKLKNGEYVKELPKLSDPASIGACGFGDCLMVPWYEADFGWGEPEWVTMAKVPTKNVAFLFSTKCGEGVEAWVNLFEEDVSLLEKDHEFLSLVK